MCSYSEAQEASSPASTRPSSTARNRTAH